MDLFQTQKVLRFGLLLLIGLMVLACDESTDKPQESGDDITTYQPDPNLPDNFELSGAFPECPMDSISLYAFNGFSPDLLYRVKVEKNNQHTFSLKGRVPEIGMYLLGRAPNNLVPVILGNGEHIQLSGDCQDLRHKSIMENSSINDSYRFLARQFQTFQKDRDAYLARLNLGIKSDDTAQQKEAEALLKQLYQDYGQLLDSLKSADSLMALLYQPQLIPTFDPNINPENYQSAAEHFAIEMFKNIDLAHPVYEHYQVIPDLMARYTETIFLNLDQAEAESYMDGVLDRMPAQSLLRKNSLSSIISVLDRLRNTAFVRYAQRYEREYSPLKNAEANYLAGRTGFFEKEILAEAKLNPGALAPEIELPTPKARIIKLSEMRGKYVLIDFWASWCRSCRAEFPRLQSTYQKYKDSGFEILSVSLDRSKSDWDQAIKEESLEWVQVSDLKYWNSRAAQDYRVDAIPANFLIGPDGKIIARNLRGSHLEENLKALLDQ